MTAPRYRRRVLRRVGPRKGKAPSPKSEAVEPIVEDDALAQAPTQIGPSVTASAPTEQLPAMGRAQDPREETEPADGLPSASSIAPDPPDRIRFVCPCGAPMTATRDTYDGRMKCDTCGSVLLVALIYEARKKAWAIEALRTKL